MRRLEHGRAWVWHGPDRVEWADVGIGSGGGWQRQPDPPEPVAIHLPNGGTHVVETPARERLGFRAPPGR